MRAFNFFLPTLLLLTALHASLSDVLPSPIYGSVNVITGQYVEDAPQIVLNSPFELGVSCSYIGPDKQLRPNCWSMGSSCLTFDHDGSTSEFPSKFWVDELDGSRLAYEWLGGTLVPDFCGLANNSGLTPEVPLMTRFEEEGCVAFQLEQEGERHIYSTNLADSRFFGCSGFRCMPLKRVERESGECVQLQYEDRLAFGGRPHPITMTLWSPAGQVLGSIQYRFSKSQSYSLTASDGQRVDYQISGSRLTKVSRLGWPDISYGYKTSTHSHYTLEEQKGLTFLTRRQEGDFVLENQYYEVSKGIRAVKYNDKFKVQNPLVNCVHKQLANVGQRPKDRVCLAEFSYRFDPKKDFFSQDVAGSCDVWDASRNRTQYTWCAGQRITSIERFKGQSELLVRETYPVRGHRVGKVISGPDGPEMAITYHTAGPTGGRLSERETVWGNLTGRSSWIRLDGEGFPVKGSGESLCHTSVYSLSGLLLEEEVDGLRTVYSYHSDSSLLASVSRFDGEELFDRISFEYDANQLVTQQTRQCGSRTYITKIHRVADGPAVGFPRRIEEYAGGQFLGAIERAYGHLNLVESETFYDATNTPSYSLYAQYDEGGRPVRVTDPEGGETTFEYDALGRLVSSHGAMGERCSYEYDHANRLTAVREGSLERRYEYDYHSRIAKASGPYSQAMTFQYDAFDRMSESCALDGSYKPRTPFHRGLCVEDGPTCHYKYDALGNCIEFTNELGEAEQYRYNIRGQITEAQYADGTSEHYTYDLSGNLTKRADRNGVVTKATYNTLGQTISVTEFGSDGARGRGFEFVYDGDLMVSMNDGQLTTMMEYDEAGRLIEVRAGDRRRGYQYDELGRPVREVVWFGGDRDRIDAVREYDRCNRVTHERVEDHAGKVWARADYAYDKSGDLLKVTSYGEGDRPEVTHFEYDSLGRPIRVTDPLGYPTTYTYGEGDTVTDPLQSVTRRTYDRLGRIASIERVDCRGTLLASTELEYSESGQLIEERHHEICEGRVVDTQSIRYTYRSGGHLEAICEPIGTTRFVYNELGQLASKVLPFGQIDYTYDSFGRLREERGAGYCYRYTYDQMGNIIAAEGPDGVTERSYDPHGQLIRERFSNGHSISHEYDGAGRRTKTTLPDGSTMRYAHDPIGVCGVERGLFSHRVIARDLSGRPLRERSEPLGLDWSFHWDESGRLIEEQTPNGVTHLAYDELGRLVLAEGRDEAGLFRESYAYDAIGQLTSECGTFSNRWSHDSFGNRQGKSAVIQSQGNGCVQNVVVENHGRIACDYDGRNQMTALNTTVQGWQYTYDPFGRRVKECHTMGPHAFDRDYIYAGDVEIGSVEGGRSEIRLMLPRGPFERPQTVGMEVGGELFSVATNRRGDITALYGSEGCAQSVRYSSFGEREVHGQEISPWGFSGKRHDSSGFVYFGRRYYLPSEGRWMAPDPAGFVDGPNRYQFCHNNPHVFIDWVGLKSERPGGGGIGDLDRGGGFGKLGRPAGGGSNVYTWVTWHRPRYYPSLARVRIKPKVDRSEPVWPARTWTVSRNAVCGALHGAVIRFPVRCGCSMALWTSYGVAYTVGWPWRDRLVSSVRASNTSCLAAADDWAVALLRPDDPIYFRAAGLGEQQMEIGAAVWVGGKVAISAWRYGGRALMTIPAVQRMEARLAGFLDSSLGARGVVSSVGEVGELTSSSRMGAIEGKAVSVKASQRFEHYSIGSYSSFRREMGTGRVVHYETRIPQTNPHNPNPWQMEKRFDGIGRGHFNKSTQQMVPTPHVHDPRSPGGVRLPRVDELPGGY